MHPHLTRYNATCTHIQHATMPHVCVCRSTPCSHASRCVYVHAHRICPSCVRWVAHRPTITNMHCSTPAAEQDYKLSDTFCPNSDGCPQHRCFTRMLIKSYTVKECLLRIRHSLVIPCMHTHWVNSIPTIPVTQLSLSCTNTESNRHLVAVSAPSRYTQLSINTKIT